MIDDLRDALYAARICGYAQGMALIRAGSDKYDWHINLAEIGRIWKGGCIIRARLLDPVRHAFEAKPDLVNLLLDPSIRDRRSTRRRPAGDERSRARSMLASRCWRTPPRSAYFDSYRTARLPQSLTQAQRDAFGAHTYERIDRPGAVHSEW